MMQQLNLSSEQQALLRDGRQSFEPKAKKIRAQMRALQQQRAELLQAGDFNGLHRLIDKQAKLKAKLHHQRLRSMAEPDDPAASQPQWASLGEPGSGAAFDDSARSEAGVAQTRLSLCRFRTGSLIRFSDPI